MFCDLRRQGRWSGNGASKLPPHVEPGSGAAVRSTDFVIRHFHCDASPPLEVVQEQERNSPNKEDKKGHFPVPNTESPERTEHCCQTESDGAISGNAKVARPCGPTNNPEAIYPETTHDDD